MPEHKVCKECYWNDYPHCLGTIMEDGSYMNIENLKPGFNCGQKELLIPADFTIRKKSDLELKIDELESRIEELESKIEANKE